MRSNENLNDDELFVELLHVLFQVSYGDVKLVLVKKEQRLSLMCEGLYLVHCNLWVSLRGIV